MALGNTLIRRKHHEYISHHLCSNYGYFYIFTKNVTLTFFRKEIKSTFIRSLLYYVPYAVLSALTFPSIFYATHNIYSSVAGCLVAIYFAYQGKGLVFVAVVAMITSYLVSFLF